MLAPLVFFIMLSALVGFTRLSQVEGWPRFTGLALWWLKLVFGVALWAVYTFYYTDRANSDIYKYYDDAAVVHQAFHQNPKAWFDIITGNENESTAPYTSQMKNWERHFNKAVPFNENHFMIRLNALLYLISGGTIHVHTIAFSFLSFIGLWLLITGFQQIVVTQKKEVLYALLFPSFWFWTSGALKESLLLLGLGLLLYGFFGMKKHLNVLWLLSGFVLLLILRYYLVLCLLPGMLFYFVTQNERTFQRTAFRFVAVNAACLLLLLLLAQTDRKLNFPRIMAKKQQHAVAEAIYMKAGSYSEVPIIDSSFSSVIVNMPVGLWNTFSKPYLGNSKNPMMLLAAAENILLVAAFIFLLIRWKRKAEKILTWPQFFFLLNVVLLYGSLIGLITPVIGNLVRYKVMLLPFTGMLLL
ncbi:MAG: hypothetical protein U0T73_03130 [Chitinophagales bacterium]